MSMHAPHAPTPEAAGATPFHEPPINTSAKIDSDRKREFTRTIINVLRVVLVVGVIVGWQLAAGDRRQGALIDTFYISQPSDIWAALTAWLHDGSLLPNFLATVTSMSYGYLLGAGLGILAGMILGSSPILSAIVHPFLVALNSIPRLAIVPLFILWFGFGLTMKTTFVACVVFFLVFYATYEGVRDVDQRLLDVLKVMNASKLNLQLKVRVPSAMSWIIQGLQVSVQYALVAAVTAEIIGSNAGIGYLIARSANSFYTAGVFAGIVILVVLALVVNALVTVLERVLLRWKPRNLTAQH